LGGTTLGTNGGVVQGTDGSQVMIPKGALTKDTSVNIIPLQQSDIATPVPDNFAVEGAFKLDFSGERLSLPAQLAIPAPAGLAPGKEVFFLREGELRDATGTWQPKWYVEESGRVGNDGMIRSSSPPWKGVAAGDNYVIAVPKFSYVVSQTWVNPQSPYLGDSAGVSVLASNVASTVNSTLGLGLFTGAFSVPTIFELNATDNSVEVVSVPKIGKLPYTTTAGVEINPNGIPIAKVDLLLLLQF
jgi:hypothetical protein